jgi:ABC-type multidrug transport system fused ATPase/permease subunit
MQILLRLARYGFRYKRYLIFAWISMLGANVLALAVPWLIGDAVDQVLADGNRRGLIVLGVSLLLISIVRGGFSYGQTYFAENVSSRVTYTLKNALLGRMQGLSFAFHDKRNTGDLMSVVTYDVESTRMFINFGMVRSLQLTILIGGITPLLLIIHWQLALISLAGVPITVYTTIKIGRRMRTIWRSVQRKMGVLTTVLQENLVGMRVVKALGAEEAQMKLFHGHSFQVSEETFSANRLRVANTAFLTFMYICATGLVILFGGRWVLGGSLTTGELSTFLLFLGLLVMPVRMLGMAVNTFSRAMSSGERIFQILDSPSPVEDKSGAREMGHAAGQVVFDKVSFSYNALTPALANISFQIEPGQKVAVLGAAGSGKTTICNLIPRFYDTTNGTVTIDGVNVKDVTLTSLRHNIGIVFQDVFLFQTTIRENISYGVNGVTAEEVEEVAKAAQLHDFIISLPEGYDTQVGERGMTLSGGQRQRLAIARTLLVNPPVLILDDSTSSVDVETEHLIRKALNQVMENRTTFIIAHRVSSVQGADLILVLKDGEVAAQGTHKELIAKDGFYKQIYELQLLPGEEVFLESAVTRD